MVNPLTDEEHARLMLEPILRARAKANRLRPKVVSAEAAEESGQRAMFDWMAENEIEEITVDGWLIQVFDALRRVIITRAK